VLASRVFARSSRMCRFLRLAVDHALAGAAEPLKEYRVGVEVFDRKADYDPRVDPIVRVEARRLRSKLKSYYASAGKSDAVIIEFPKGGYVPAFRVRAAARSAPRRGTASSIAVLPFTNLTPEAVDDYFTDGLAEELNLLLTRVDGLRVVAWHSAAQMRGRDHDLREIRERLKVATVLKGAVRRTAEQIRVTVQLIETGSGAVLWSEAYGRAMSQMYLLQEDIAWAIVDTLRVALRASRASVDRTATNLECYNLCLQGRYHANKRTGEGLRKSAECYEQALQHDASSSIAYAGLADAHSLLCDYGWVHPTESMPKAEAAAMKALALDSHSADAIASLAYVRSVFHWRWQEAEGLYRQAIAMNPSNAKARHWYAIDHLLFLGRFQEAREQVSAARMLDPLSLIIQEGHAYLSMICGDTEAAVKDLQRLIELDPGFFKLWSTLGRTYSLAGRYDEAIRAFEKARELDRGVPSIVAAMGQTKAWAGDRDAARQALEDLAAMAAQRHVPSTCYAILHLSLDEKERCLDWLERAVNQHELQVGLFNVHPLYRPLRGEPRFRALLERIGFLP
jgi:TolB-like protein/Flp pilus assembly protein TadD